MNSKYIVRFAVFAAALMATAAVFAEGDDAMIVDPDYPIGLRYGANEYVTNGLVSWFDGICNAGLDVPHDGRANVWKNLVPGAPDAVFRASSTYPDLDVSDYGEWTDLGYVFDGRSYAVLNTGIPLGTNFTMQTAQDTPPKDQPNDLSGAYREVVAASSYYYPCFLSNVEDFSFFVSNAPNGDNHSAKLWWKGDGGYYALMTNDGRCNVVSWKGMYINAGIDEGNMYLTQNDSWPAGMQRTATNTSDAVRWSWGGADSIESRARIRYTRGTYYAVRFYDRLLTDAELARNRVLDETRFHGAPPVTNVFLQTSQGLLSGFDHGAKAVNGTYTFLPPAGTNMLGGIGYAYDGTYILDGWNEERNTWERIGIRTGDCYAYTNTLSTAKMRVTWNLKPVSGVRRYDVTGYVQDGLVLHYDGIANAGVDSQHVSDATVWRNLVPGGLDANRVDFTEDAAFLGSWAADGYRLVGSNKWQVVDTIYVGESLSWQVVLDYSAVDQINDYPTPVGTPKDNCNVFLNNTTTTLRCKLDASLGTDIAGINRPTKSSWDGEYVDLLLDRGSVSLTDGKGKPSLVMKKFKYTPGNGYKWSFGGAMDNAQRSLVGTIHAVRLYNRLLSADEIAWNRELDEIRFRGASRKAASNVVEIVCGLAEAEQASGWCRIFGETTFRAPCQLVEAEGVTNMCYGCRVERWNAEAGAYANAEEHLGDSVTLTCDDDLAPRRLTWLWREAGRLLSVDAFDVDDYVAEGLVAHYDGIRNVGAYLAHDSEAERWRNLVPGGADLGRIGLDTSAGRWLDDGYELTGSNAWQMVDDVVVGVELTVQQVLDVDRNAQKTQYQMYFAPTADHGPFTQYKAEDDYQYPALTWKFDAYGSANGARAKISDWKGKYISAGGDSNFLYFTETANWGKGVARSVTNEVGAARWTIGTGAGGYVNIRLARGVFKSTRIYNRLLSADELAWNRLVDEARFNGVLSTTNVLVVGGARHPAVEADGPYVVRGMWPFSAAEVRNGGKLEYTPVGYTLETLENGVWGEPEYHAGTVYNYRAGVSPATVRLTWKWESSRGLTVNFR